MSGLHHQVAVIAPVERVYRTIARPERIGSWWDEQSVVESDRRLILEHDSGPEHGIVRLRVVDRRADRRVEWRCISEHDPASPASAWTGTRFRVDLSTSDSPAAKAERACVDVRAPITTVDFRHLGIDIESPFAGFSNFAWGQILSSLKRTCERSTGGPASTDPGEHS